MFRYLLKRLLLLIPLLFGISLIVFLFIHMIPGDPAIAILGEHASPAALAKVREELGLNDPIHIQYMRFLTNLLRGDLGRSFISHNLVADELKARFPATIELAVASMLFATLVGVPAGVISAVKQYSLFDHISMVIALFGVSMPIFWLGLMMIWVGSLELGIFPPSGRLSVDIVLEPVTNFVIIDAIVRGNWTALKDALMHLAMPAVALGTIPMAIIARMTRSSILEVLRQDYIRTARAKGLAYRTVISKHALKNGLIPVVTVVGLQFGSLLGGAVLTETIFSWPGVGRLAYQAVMERDFPLLQGTILLVASCFVLINLLVDVIYGFLDPKIRYE